VECGREVADRARLEWIRFQLDETLAPFNNRRSNIKNLIQSHVIVSDRYYHMRQNLTELKPKEDLADIRRESTSLSSATPIRNPPIPFTSSRLFFTSTISHTIPSHMISHNDLIMQHHFIHSSLPLDNRGTATDHQNKKLMAQSLDSIRAPSSNRTACGNAGRTHRDTVKPIRPSDDIGQSYYGMPFDRCSSSQELMTQYSLPAASSQHQVKYTQRAIESKKVLSHARPNDFFPVDRQDATDRLAGNSLLVESQVFPRQLLGMMRDLPAAEIKSRIATRTLPGQGIHEYINLSDFVNHNALGDNAVIQQRYHIHSHHMHRYLSVVPPTPRPAFTSSDSYLTDADVDISRLSSTRARLQNGTARPDSSYITTLLDLLRSSVRRKRHSFLPIPSRPTTLER
jgi:hypothetical protein